MDTRTLCLGVLSMGDASGYQIKKTFEEAFSHFYGAGFGSIYPALAGLAREGLIEGREVAQDGRPVKKVYRITAAGRRALAATLAAQEPRHKVRSEFLVLTFFSHLLAPERLHAVLDQRCADIDASLRHLHDVLARADLPPGVRFTAGYGEAVLSAALEYLQRHGHELERAVDAGRSLAQAGPS